MKAKIEKIKRWKHKIDEFVKWLNDSENAESLNRQLHDLDQPGTIFDGLKETAKPLAKIASTLSALSAEFDSFAIQAPSRMRDAEAEAREY